jgi:hypothetical protein
MAEIAAAALQSSPPPPAPRPMPLTYEKSMSYVLQDNLPDFPKKKEIADNVGWVYGRACGFSEDLPVGFATGVLLLALTGISWIMHSNSRSSRRGQPIMLKTGG